MNRVDIDRDADGWRNPILFLAKVAAERNDRATIWSFN